MSIQLLPELEFRTSRSGGSGGQNVNKVETQVEVRWNVAATAMFSEDQKAILIHKLAAKLNKEGILAIRSQHYRSQLENKQDAIDKLHLIVQQALVTPKKRLKTKIPKGVKENRLKGKKVRSEIKSLRRKPIL